ncbi:hypothetical protein [Armatimonas sp.]|uniref:hypothetical protein n=1 Tax=Armatimonas sp. TaxID=1872638 RepID=UPI00286BC75C|nr:hypothetical protein [Armatimonas sp.]
MIYYVAMVNQAPRGSALETKAAALSSAGKLHEAGDAFTSAAKAYTAEGNSSAAAKAYGKAAELYEPQADALLNPTRTPQAAPLPQTQVPRPAVAPVRTVAPSPLAPRAGMIVGRVINELGGAATSVTVRYSGFQEGKPIFNHFENVEGDVKAAGGSYTIRVPPGDYRVSAYATYIYQGRTYHFELEALNPPARHDLDGLGLDHLRGGLVRDFVLKMTAKKAGASEETETVYNAAYYGGRLNFDCGQTEQIMGGGHTFAPPLAGLVDTAYPPDSRLQITLTPQGALVDGSAGRVVTIKLRLGDHGTYPFSQRGIFPGVYIATATVTTPSGKTIPLRLSLTRARTILKGSPDGYDMTVMDWKPSVLVDFLPSDIGPMPRFGVKPVMLFLGK